MYFFSLSSRIVVVIMLFFRFRVFFDVAASLFECAHSCACVRALLCSACTCVKRKKRRNSRRRLKEAGECLFIIAGGREELWRNAEISARRNLEIRNDEFDSRNWKFRKSECKLTDVDFEILRWKILHLTQDIEILNQIIIICRNFNRTKSLDGNKLCDSWNWNVRQRYRESKDIDFETLSRTWLRNSWMLEGKKFWFWIRL